MANSPLSSAEMKQEIRPHHAPAQPRSPAHGGVGIGNVEDSEINQIDDFAVQGRLEAVRDMTDDFLLQANRFLADLRIKGDCPVECLGRCLFSADDLDQWNEMGWVKRMSDNASFGMLAG